MAKVNPETKKSVQLQPYKTFQKKLSPIKEQFDSLLKEYGVKNGVSIFVSNGRVVASIGIDEFKQA